MDTLDKLFGSSARIRLLRLFLLNPDTVFELREVTKRTKVGGALLRKEINLLRNIRLLSKKTVTHTHHMKNGKKRVTKREGAQLMRSFTMLAPLRNLLFNTEPFENNEIIRRFKSTGNMKYVAVAGVFTQDPDSRIDLVLVGDKLKRGNVEKVIRGMESEIGKELAYAIFETNEFKYRLEVYDKFVRDILDYPHRVIMDKIGV